MRKILFICWANCVRSQMAEALLTYRSAGRFEAASAGANPAGFVHALTIQTLRESLVPAKGLRSKPWTDFENETLDAVVTLCDYAREEIEVSWPPEPGGSLPVRVHWPFVDPVGEEYSRGRVLSDEERLEAFRLTRDEIRESVERLATTPSEALRDDRVFADLMRRIGESLEEE